MKVVNICKAVIVADGWEPCVGYIIVLFDTLLTNCALQCEYRRNECIELSWVLHIFSPEYFTCFLVRILSEIFYKNTAAISRFHGLLTEFDFSMRYYYWPNVYTTMTILLSIPCRLTPVFLFCHFPAISIFKTVFASCLCTTEQDGKFPSYILSNPALLLSWKKKRFCSNLLLNASPVAW